MNRKELLAYLKRDDIPFYSPTTIKNLIEFIESLPLECEVLCKDCKWWSTERYCDLLGIRAGQMFACNKGEARK